MEIIRKATAAEQILQQKSLHLQRNLLFQSIGDLKSIHSFQNANNDDLIIECVLFYGAEYNARALLLTRDNNLGLKAAVNGMVVLKSLPMDVHQAISMILLQARQILPATTMDIDTKTLSPNLSVNMEVENQPPTVILAKISNLVEISPLSHCIRSMLAKNIGPQWSKLLVMPYSDRSNINDENWTCSFMLRIIDQHWNAVFASDLPRSVRHLAGTCVKEWRELQLFCSASSLKSFCSHIRLLLMAFGIDENERLGHFESIL